MILTAVRTRNETTARRCICAWSIAAALVTLLLGVPASDAQISADAAKCRSGIAKGVSRLADTTFKEREKCHKLRMKGQLAATTDCNDPARSPAVPKITKATQKLADVTMRACASILRPSQTGFFVCSAPCDGAIGTYTDVAECLACLTESHVDDALEQAYGAPPVLPPMPGVTACQSAIGSALRKYGVTRLQEQRKCQRAQDHVPTGVDCRSMDLTGKIGAAWQAASLTIAGCSAAQVASLNSCGADVGGEQDCIRAAAEVNGDALFDAIYRPPVPTPSPTLTATPVNTATPTVTLTSVPTDTPLPTNTPAPSPTNTPVPTSTPTNLPAVHVDITPFPAQGTLPCLIFVHGKQTNTDTYTDWNAARDYWKSGSDDLIRTATKNFAASYYVVGYNGTQAYWDAQAAGEVANEIANATNGGPDGGGNRCARTFAAGGTFWVIGHSMAGSVVDYILGNDDPTDQNYNANGPYDVAAQRISLAVTIAGTHRGSQGADLVCGGGNPFCSFFAQFVQSCDTATYWLRSSDDVQVKTYASAPAKNVWLTGGYAAIIGASACLSGEDDGIVQHASAYACNGSATASYTNDSVCDNNNKQEVSGFKNLDSAHENHDQERNDSHSDTRVAIPTGVWVCNGASCSPGNSVQGSMSTARFVSLLY